MEVVNEDIPLEDSYRGPWFVRNRQGSVMFSYAKGKEAERCCRLMNDHAKRVALPYVFSFDKDTKLFAQLKCPGKRKPFRASRGRCSDKKSDLERLYPMDHPSRDAW